MKFSEKPDRAALKGFTGLTRMYGDDALIKGYVACRTPTP